MTCHEWWCWRATSTCRGRESCVANNTRSPLTLDLVTCISNVMNIIFSKKPFPYTVYTGIVESRFHKIPKMKCRKIFWFFLLLKYWMSWMYVWCLCCVRCVFLRRALLLGGSSLGTWSRGSSVARIRSVAKFLNVDKFYRRGQWGFIFFYKI